MVETQSNHFAIWKLDKTKVPPAFTAVHCWHSSRLLSVEGTAWHQSQALVMGVWTHSFGKSPPCLAADPWVQVRRVGPWAEYSEAQKSQELWLCIPAEGAWWQRLSPLPLKGLPPSVLVPYPPACQSDLALCQGTGSPLRKLLLIMEHKSSRT